MASVHPQVIAGRWRRGHVLDQHTVDSNYLGVDDHGHPRFESRRTEIGELLYRLKYRQDRSVVAELVETASSFIARSNTRFDLIVPVPASGVRPVQPVAVVAEGVGLKLGIEVSFSVTTSRTSPQLKDIADPQQRQQQLEDLYRVNADQTTGKAILVFDDGYRSGATMNAVTRVLYEQGRAADVCALALTRTRSNT